MHAKMVIIASAAMTGAGLAGCDLPLRFQVAAAAALVAFIGVPHGALDHWVGRELLAGTLPQLWLPAFLLGYASIGLVVVAGWFLAPTLTLILFFLLSSWHFGLEEQSHPSYRPWRQVAAMARGGMLIWIPAITQRSELESLLAVIIPGNLAASAEMAVEVAALSGWVFAFILSVDLLRSVREQPLSVFRVLIFAAMFAVVKPLIAFTIYFCGWHSVIGLRDLYVRQGLQLRSFLINLLPLTLATITLGAIGFLILSRTQSGSSAMLRTIFIGLSAIAVPHLLLHITADTVRFRRERHEAPGLLGGAAT